SGRIHRASAGSGARSRLEMAASFGSVSQARDLHVEPPAPPRGAERWRSGGSERVEAGVERGWIGGDDRDVAELSAGARALAVEVQVRAGHGEDALGVGQRADDVDHRALSAG